MRSRQHQQAETSLKTTKRGGENQLDAKPPRPSSCCCLISLSVSLSLCLSLSVCLSVSLSLSPSSKPASAGSSWLPAVRPFVVPSGSHYSCVLHYAKLLRYTIHDYNHDHTRLHGLINTCSALHYACFFGLGLGFRGVLGCVFFPSLQVPQACQLIITLRMFKF